MAPALTLLIDCCRQRLGLLAPGPLAERLRQADGNLLLALARRQGLEVLLWSTLRNLGIVLPGTAALGADARRLASGQRDLASESLRVHGALAASSIPHLFVGGPLLGSLTWQDPELGTGAIRLLALQPSIGKVGALLAAVGFVQEQPDPSVDPADWHRQARRSRWRSDDGSLLDLDGRLSDHPALLSKVTATTPPQQVDLGGGATLPTLPFTLLLPALAVEGAEQSWHRLCWVAEFAALVRRVPRSGLEQMAEVAARHGAERPLSSALVLSHRLLGTDVPDGLWFDRSSAKLVDLAMARLSDTELPEQGWAGSAAVRYGRLLLQPGSHFFMSAALRQLGGLLTR
jgi:hypothetical protein